MTGMTAEEFWEWACRQPDHDRRFELHRGEVVEFPLSGMQHGLLCGWLCHLFFQQVIARGTGYATANNAALLVSRQPDTVLGPDLMLFDQSKRLEEMSDSFVTTVPRLAVEVLSPEDRWPAILQRAADLLRCGVPHIWMVDPGTRTVVVFRPGEIHRVLQATDELTGDGVLTGLRLSVDDIFRLAGETTT